MEKSISPITVILNRILSLFFWLIGIIYIYPLFLCIISSFKTRADLAESTVGLPAKWILNNYNEAFIKAGFLLHFKNSIIVTALSLVIMIIIGAPAAYSVTRWNSKWAKWSLSYFLCGLIAPAQLALVPLYKIMRDLHLSGTPWGLSVLFAVNSLALSIFLWASFIKSIPADIEESARIDGCSLFRMFWQIIFPLLKPVTVTLIILQGTTFWNDFLFGLLFLSKPNSQTLPLSIYTFVGQYGNDWTKIFAVIVLIEAPILVAYLFAQKHIIKGMVSGAVKG